jgi:hypothetical protein
MKSNVLHLGNIPVIRENPEKSGKMVSIRCPESILSIIP